ncbi:MAG: zinc metallopeptidase [Clostridia bacterium]|nr:zinc metallopeptidase [Clostridia bacterium]
MGWEAIISDFGLIILTLLIPVAASFYVKYQYSVKSKIMNMKGITGGKIARMILDKNGLNDVKVQSIEGSLSDHYDPTKKVVNLSTAIYANASIASIAVAAHECGHAIQDKENDTFMKLRSSLVPITNICSYAGYVAIIIGSIATITNLLWLGIILMLVVLAFQLVTLPVEFGASNRALKELDETYCIGEDEIKACKSMLIAAALTYVASVITLLLEILRLFLIARNSDDN